MEEVYTTTKRLIFLTKNSKNKEADECYKKGEAYGADGDADRAIEWMTKTIELDPEYFLAWYNLGNVYFWGKQDAQKDFEHWEKALEIKPEASVILRLIRAIKNKQAESK